MTVVPCSRDSWVKSSVIVKKRLSKNRSRWANRGQTCKTEDLTSHQVLPLWSKGKRRQMIANRLQTWSTSSTMALSQVKMNQPFRALNHNLVSVSYWQKETTKTRVGTETMRQQISSLVTIVLISKMLNSKWIRTVMISSQTTSRANPLTSVTSHPFSTAASSNWFPSSALT